jgi:hypothetical protein
LEISLTTLQWKQPNARFSGGRANRGRRLEPLVER